MSYSAQTEWLNESQLKQFRRELESDPTGPPISRGTSALAALMSGAKGREGQIPRKR